MYTIQTCFFYKLDFLDYLFIHSFILPLTGIARITAILPQTDMKLKFGFEWSFFWHLFAYHN